jgi:hypothetical protein
MTSIFASVEALRRAYPTKRFTPGDKLIGDTGEALAEHLFVLERLNANSKDHDYRSRELNKHVQVKTTSGNRVGLGLTKVQFQHLVVFKIYADGSFEMLYNGDGARIAKATRHNASSGIQVPLLKTLDAQVRAVERLRRRSHA